MSASEPPRREDVEARPLHDYIDMEAYDVVSGEHHRAEVARLTAELERAWIVADGRLHEWEQAEAELERVQQLAEEQETRADRAEAELERVRWRLAALETPHHTLILGPNRWTVEHTLACRESGRMDECEVHQRVSDWIDDVGRPDLADGRYVIGDGALPDALAATPTREAGDG